MKYVNVMPWPEGSELIECVSPDGPLDLCNAASFTKLSWTPSPELGLTFRLRPESLSWAPPTDSCELRFSGIRSLRLRPNWDWDPAEAEAPIWWTRRTMIREPEFSYVDFYVAGHEIAFEAPMVELLLINAEPQQDLRDVSAT